MRRLALALLAAIGIAAMPVHFALTADGYYLEDHFTFLADYAYAETPAKPAEMVLASLDGTEEGSVTDEISRAADAFGIDRNYMLAVAKIESDFNPHDKTGSYIGLYQLSEHEFHEYGKGDITDPRDNAMAAAAKFTTEAAEFKIETHKKATPADLYLVHQQGIQGAVEHINHPERPAWKSMCATDEGRQKGEKWCKRAIWGNTLPAVKQIWKTVDALTSGAFVEMWRERVTNLFFQNWGTSTPPSEARAARARHREWHHRHHKRHRRG